MTARTKSWWRAAAFMRSCSACKPPATADQPGFGAGLLGEIPQSHLHANLLEEFAGRRTAGEDPDVIVGDLADFAVHVEPDGTLPNFYGLRVEDHLQLPGLDVFLHLLLVAIFQAAERIAAVRQRHPIAALVREAHRRFDSAVAAAHDEDLRIRVGLRLDQAVHHFGELLPRNSQFPRRATAPEREDDAPSAVLDFGRLDREGAIRFLADILDFLARVDLESRLPVQLLPEAEELLFGDLELVELAVHRELDGTREDQLLTRILGDGAPEFVLLDRDVGELALDGAKRRADASGSRADDADVVYAGHRATPLDAKEAAGDRVHAIATLVDRVLDERQAAKFSRDEHVGHGGLVRGTQLRHVGADVRTRHYDRDRADGTCLGAQAVADALVTVHDRGLARDHGEHVPLRADVHARAAADALRRVDVGVLGARPVGAELAALRGRMRGGLLPIHPPNMADDREEQDQTKRDIRQRRVHGLLR